MKWNERKEKKICNKEQKIRYISFIQFTENKSTNKQTKEGVYEWGFR